jgi:hypothetical protein
MAEIKQFVSVERQGNPDFANKLREIADRVESGEITDIAFVCNDREQAYYGRSVSFNDRWRLLGAIEWAKQGILDAS